MSSERHPRRAYDKDGTMLPPAMVASTRAHGLTSITATCHAPGCHRSADVSLDGFSDDMPVPDIAPLLKCSACGGKRITVMTNMREWYALCRARRLGGAVERAVPMTEAPPRRSERGALLCVLAIWSETSRYNG